MNRQRVVIVGGGMAGLTAAYHLSRTAELRRRYAVDVYQMGWRLGGKGASGRRDGAIIEHGLHVWFGCYDNAFDLTAEVYQRWKGREANRFKSLADAFQPVQASMIGDQFDGQPVFHTVHWPTRGAPPWESPPVTRSPLWATLGRLISLVARLPRDDAELAPAGFALGAAGAQDLLSTLGAQAAAVGREDLAAGLRALHDGPLLSGPLDTAAAWAELADGLPATEQAVAGDGILALIDEACAPPAGELAFAPMAMARGRLAAELLQVFRAFSSGVVRDLLLGGETIDTLDRLEFRDWLVRHGADRAVVNRSPVVRCLYDTMFQYVEGDQGRPSYAAGTAIQVVLRIHGTYRGALLYLMNAGMGEVVISPLYEVLLQQGVRFHFFHKATRLGLDETGKAVARVTLQRQAELHEAAYRPLERQHGLPVWPDEPVWDQLVNGHELQAAGVDFESHWSPHDGRDIELRHGRDFDQVVLAASIGAFKPLNDEDASMCDELVGASEDFARMVHETDLVPSLSAQLWPPKTVDELGHAGPRPCAVSGPPQLGIWADMSHLLEVEAHDGAGAPASVHYFCGVYDTQAFRQPARDRDVPAATREDVDAETKAWFARHGPVIWPEARDAAGDFDMSMIEARYVRPNINPTDCCASSAAGTTLVRLPAGGSGFANLVLAGCWIDTGLNTTCIESATMSGMQAARAICGAPREVPGEHFLRPRPDAAKLPVGCLGLLLQPIAGWLWRDREDRGDDGQAAGGAAPSRRP